MLESKNYYFTEKSQNEELANIILYSEGQTISKENGSKVSGSALDLFSLRQLANLKNNEERKIALSRLCETHFDFPLLNEHGGENKESLEKLNKLLQESKKFLKEELHFDTFFKTGQAPHKFFDTQITDIKSVLNFAKTAWSFDNGNIIQGPITCALLKIMNGRNDVHNAGFTTLFFKFIKK